MSTHKTNAAKSDRLQKTLAVLTDGLWHTTWEIAQRTQSVAAHQDIQDLRLAGYSVIREYCGKNENGRQINRYRWNPTQQPTLLEME
jgi:hypothetical protein